MINFNPYLLWISSSSKFHPDQSEYLGCMILSTVEQGIIGETCQLWNWHCWFCCPRECEMGRDCSTIIVDVFHNCKPIPSSKQIALPHIMSVVAQAEPRQDYMGLTPAERTCFKPRHPRPPITHCKQIQNLSSLQPQQSKRKVSKMKRFLDRELTKVESRDFLSTMERITPPLIFGILSDKTIWRDGNGVLV